MTAPIRITVIRHRCPTCPKSYAGKSRAIAHMSRCWFNPEARGCKTCKHFEPNEEGPYRGHPGFPEQCAEGVNLAGQPGCASCNGFGWSGSGDVCPECDGGETCAEVKPGPIVHCDEWEPAASP